MNRLEGVPLAGITGQIWVAFFEATRDIDTNNGFC
jgi:hypothetical protein